MAKQRSIKSRPPKKTGGTLVMKFGGTSVGSVEALSLAAEIVLTQENEWERVVVVVSAMSGVTNDLIACAHAAADGDEEAYQRILSELHSHHRETVENLFSQDPQRGELLATLDGFFAEITSYCSSIYTMSEVTNRGMDAITSFGERMNARVFSALLRWKGINSQAIDATELIVTDAKYQDASPKMRATCARITKNLVPILDDKIIPVVTGFMGATEDGIITTLGRGGSDYTASILGDCLDASEVWTLTDVDGVMTADPRLVKEARVIPEISFYEVSEMAYFGAKVLHPKSIRPIIERDIPLWVKNTFNFSNPGTKITSKKNRITGKISAVTSLSGLSLVTVEGRGMLGVPGIAARTFSAVAKEGTSVLMISQASSEQSICFVIPSDAVPKVTQSIEQEMALELSRGDIDRVWAQDDVVIVTAIGAGLRKTPGVSARVFGALGEAEINVIAIAQGSSEYSISIVIAADDVDHAVQKIHKEVIINES